MQPCRSSDPKRFHSCSPATCVAVLLGLVVGAGLFTSLEVGQTVSEGQKGGDGKKIKVLPVGSFHFARAPDFNDPQAEIKAVVDSLLDFRPTKVAIERERKDSTYVDSLYRAYRADRYDLEVNEAYQLGFRLARRRGHEEVYPIDYKLAWPMDKPLTWAKENQPSFPRYVNRWQKRMGEVSDSIQRHGTIRETLLHKNTGQCLSRIQAIRMRTLEVGAAQNYIGVEPPASIARRNMRIFANLLAAAEPGDRIVIIYGAGHIHYFREQVRGHPQMELVYPREYL